MSWRAYFLTLLSACGITLAAGALVNFLVEVRGVYRNIKFEFSYDDYARRLLESSYGLVVVVPERSVKLRMAELANSDCLVMGSSHEMQIDLETMPLLREKCRQVVNLAVSGGTFEDFIAAAGRIANNPHARHLFIGIAPWFFRAQADERWVEEEENYFEARRLFGLGATRMPMAARFAKLSNLLNGSYFHRNLDALWRRGGGAISASPSITPVGFDGREAHEDEPIYRPTGRLIYSRSALAKGPLPPAQVGDGGYKISRPIFSPGLLEEFEQVVSHLKGRGMAVDFLLMPYHPKVLSCGIAAVCETLAAVEAKIRECARRQGSTVIGSYDPRLFDLGDEDFFDDMHMAASALWKIHDPGRIRKRHVEMRIGVELDRGPIGRTAVRCSPLLVISVSLFIFPGRARQPRPPRRQQGLLFFSPDQTTFGEVDGCGPLEAHERHGV